MVQKLGKIEKPSLAKFRHGRKLFCVPLIPYLQSEEAQEDFQEKVSLYWKQANEQVSNLEKVGKITCVYHESITSNGESAMNAMKRINEKCYQFVKAKLEQGARLEVVEDRETLDEYLDWSICLSVIGRSQKVVNQIIDFQGKVAKRRYDHIAKRIKETLEDDEAGLLIMTEENRMSLQSYLPSDIQVFLVRPPALNDVQRWLRDYMIERMKKENVEQKAEEFKDSPEK